MKLLPYNQILSALEDAQFVIMDQKLIDLYPGLLEVSKSTHCFLLAGPESCKNLTFFEQAIEKFIRAGITRSDKIFVIGGGATSDLGGFVAATILRGIEWVVIPTTLLSMIDASIGGKVGINTGLGKNLIGNFHLPQEILISEIFLSTLSEMELLSGKGELLKYIFLSSKIHKQVEASGFNKELIFSCAEFKQEIVANDLNEKGERKKLNLGHTFGHAFEKALRIPHGVAVVFGLELILKLYRPELVSKFNELKIVLGLENLKIDKVDFDSFIQYLMVDKKRLSNKEVELILPNNNFTIEYRIEKLEDIKKLIQNHADYRSYFK